MGGVCYVFMIIFFNKFEMWQEYTVLPHNFIDSKEWRSFAVHPDIAHVHSDNRVQVRAQCLGDLAKQVPVHNGCSDPGRNAMERTSKVSCKLIPGIKLRLFP